MMPYQLSPQLISFLKLQPARTILAADAIQNFVDSDVVTVAPANEHTTAPINILFDQDSSGMFELFIADSALTHTAQLTEH